MIGIIDSGMGGLSTLATLIHAKADHQFLYYADVLHAPYGNKGQWDIYKTIKTCIHTLCGYGVDQIVIACNTASFAALSACQGEFSVPIYGVLPSVDEAKEAGGTTLLLATAYTTSQPFPREIVPIALPSLATLVDLYYPYQMEPILSYLERELSGYNGIENVVLGCTHYELIGEEIRSILRAKRTFYGSNTILRQLKKATPGTGWQLDILSSGSIDHERYSDVLSLLLDRQSNLR